MRANCESGLDAERAQTLLCALPHAVAAARGHARLVEPASCCATSNTPPHAIPCAWQGYDRTTVPMALTGVLLGVGAAASAAGMFVFQVRAATYARPLSYHKDVLGQKY